jgi:hypothetical protein
MKRMFLVILAAGSAAVANAQIQFGVKAGVNLANLSLSNNNSGISLSNKTDFNAGALLSIPLFSSFHLQPEVMYSNQGASTVISGTTYKINYSYLNVPVLFKYQHETGLFAETGPQFGFLLSAKQTASGQPTSDTKSDTQSTDFSWAFGVGYKIPIINLGIDARYNLGLTNLAKSSSNADGTAKNSVFQIDLFYMFKGL